MKKYFIKSLFSGWNEVSEDRFNEYVENLKNGSINIPQEEKSAFIAEKTEIVEMDDTAIMKALEVLGYDLQKYAVTIQAYDFQRYKVTLNGQYFGVWDCNRNTFVD